MKNMKLRELVLCALFIALVAVGAFIKIPVGTDIFTLQFLFTLLAGLLLGGRLGAEHGGKAGIAAFQQRLLGMGVERDFRPAPALVQAMERDDRIWAAAAQAGHIRPQQ